MSENRYSNQDVESAQRSLEMLSAAIAATDRHGEVLSAIAGASDKDHARAAVATLLSLTDDQAEMVLNLQWYRVTSEARDEFRRHRGDVEEVLRRRRASHRNVRPNTTSVVHAAAPCGPRAACRLRLV